LQAEAGVTDADQDRSKADEGKGPQAAAEIGHVGQKHIIFNGVSAHGGAELDRIRASQTEFEAAVAAMAKHFCTRFMLITQHGFLPRIPRGSRTPVAAVSDAIAKNRLPPIEPAAGAAAIMGVILQTVTFHVYGRLAGSLSARAIWRARR
jgi:hypothetical protein